MFVFPFLLDIESIVLEVYKSIVFVSNQQSSCLTFVCPWNVVVAERLNINLHAQSCFANSKLCRVCPVETVDTISSNDTVLSLAKYHSVVSDTCHHHIFVDSANFGYKNWNDNSNSTPILKFSFQEDHKYESKRFGFLQELSLAVGVDQNQISVKWKECHWNITCVAVNCHKHTSYVGIVNMRQSMVQKNHMAILRQSSHK